MYYISKEPSIKTLNCSFCTAQEEMELRNSEQTRYVAKVMSKNCYTAKEKKQKKKFNYYRICQATVAGNPEEIQRGGSTGYVSNNRVTLDIDDHDGKDKELTKRIYQKLKTLKQPYQPLVLNVERSISKKGVHIDVVILEGLSIEENIAFWEEILDERIDHNTKDLGRALYLVPTEYMLYTRPAYWAETKSPIKLQEAIDWKEQYKEKIRKEAEEKARVVEEARKGMEDYKPVYDDEAKECKRLIHEVIVPSGVDITETEEAWFHILCAIANTTGDEFLAHDVSQFHPRYDFHETRKKFAHAMSKHYNYGLGTLIHHMRQHGLI